MQGGRARKTLDDGYASESAAACPSRSRLVWARAAETDVALALVEADGVSERRGRVAGAAGAIQHGREVDERVAALGDVVGALGESHCFARGRLGALELAARCEDVRAGGELREPARRCRRARPTPRRGRRNGCASSWRPCSDERDGQQRGGGRALARGAHLLEERRGSRGPRPRRARALRRAARAPTARTPYSPTTSGLPRSSIDASASACSARAWSMRPCIACSTASWRSSAAGVLGWSANRRRSARQRSIPSAAGTGPKTVMSPRIPAAHAAVAGRRRARRPPARARDSPMTCSKRSWLTWPRCSSIEAMPSSSPSASSSSRTGSRRRVQRGQIGLARRAVHRHAQLHDAGARGGPPVAVRARELQRGGRGCGATLQIPDVVERIGELDEDRRAVCLRSQRQRALQQPDRRRVVALGGPPAGGAKAARRARREFRGGGLGLAELAPEQDGALEVVAEQLIGDRHRARRPRPAGSRSARAARRAAPSASPRRRRRGSAGGGSGRCPRSAPTARMRSLRMSARRWTSTGSPAPSPTSASTRSRANSLPSIDAASMTARSPGPSRSRRAAISA